MEKPTFSLESKKFSTPAEELEFLREKVASHERESNSIEQAPKEEKYIAR